MSLYLAWSFEKLLFSLIFGYAVLWITFYALDRIHEIYPRWGKYTIKGKFVWLLVYTLMILYGAINVGIPQNDLKRSNFNSSIQESLEKKEVKVLDNKEVTNQYKSRLKDFK